MRRAIRAWACALSAVATLGLSGCSTVQNFNTTPQVQSVSVRVAAFDLRKIDLRFDVELLNPGNGRIAIGGYEYDLYLEGQPLLAGRSNVGFELAPRGTARVAVPVTLALADLQRTLAGLKGRGEVAYRLAVTLRIDTPLGAFRFPLTKDGCVSMVPPFVHSCQ